MSVVCYVMGSQVVHLCTMQCTVSVYVSYILLYYSTMKSALISPLRKITICRWLVPAMFELFSPGSPAEVWGVFSPLLTLTLMWSEQGIPLLPSKGAIKIACSRFHHQPFTARKLLVGDFQNLHENNLAQSLYSCQLNQSEGVDLLPAVVLKQYLFFKTHLYCCFIIIK